MKPVSFTQLDNLLLGIAHDVNRTMATMAWEKLQLQYKVANELGLDGGLPTLLDWDSSVAHPIIDKREDGTFDLYVNFPAYSEDGASTEYNDHGVGSPVYHTEAITLEELNHFLSDHAGWEAKVKQAFRVDFETAETEDDDEDPK